MKMKPPANGQKKVMMPITQHKHTFVPTKSGNRKVCTMCGQKEMA